MNEPFSLRGLLPLPLWLAFAVALLAGLGLFLTRPARLENATYEALKTCGASVLPETNGLNDAYGVINVRQNNAETVAFFSMCESKPEMALRIFRRALKEGSKDARLVAIHAAFLLRHHLEKSDFDELVNLLNNSGSEKDADVCKAAQRRISELLVMTNLTAKDKYEELPSTLPPAGEKETPCSIQTLEVGPEGKKVLRIRWSSPEVACAWWKATAAGGAWDAAQGAFIIH